MKAIIVDDSRAIRKLLTRMLGPFGFEVVEAGNGREALEVLAAGFCDLALVDWNMPEMDGYDFLVAMRADKRNQETKVVMVTTETESAKIEKALDAGANEYIMKPFTEDVLKGKLAILGFGVAL